MKLGKESVDEMLSRMTSKDVAEWMAYDEIEPFGEVVDDYRWATLASIFASAWSKKTYGPNHFMLTKEKPKQQSEEDMKKVLGVLVKQGKMIQK